VGSRTAGRLQATFRQAPRGVTLAGAHESRFEGDENDESHPPRLALHRRSPARLNRERAIGTFGLINVRRVLNVFASAIAIPAAGV